jgi:hypothetical protein
MQVMERVTVVATLLPGATTNLCLSPGRLAVYAGVILAISVLAASVATAESVTVSRLSRAPRVNDFANPESSSIQTEMATIERLIQRTPVHSPLYLIHGLAIVVAAITGQPVRWLFHGAIWGTTPPHYGHGLAFV